MQLPAGISWGLLILGLVFGIDALLHGSGVYLLTCMNAITIGGNDVLRARLRAHGVPSGPVWNYGRVAAAVRPTERRMLQAQVAIALAQVATAAGFIWLLVETLF